MRKSFILYSLLAFSFIVLLFQSCEILNNDPEYNGTWQATEVITTDGMIYNNLRTISLTKSSYEETYVIMRENQSTPVAIIGTRGSLGSSHSNLIFSLRELGACILDEADACTENVQWFGKGSSYYSDNIRYFQMTVSGQFEINGTSLKLIRDLNADGDTGDEGEDVIFEKI